MLINNDTAPTLAATLKERLQEMLKKEEMQVYHGDTKHGIPFHISIQSNPAAKLDKVVVNVCGQERLSTQLPFANSKAKTNRAMGLASLYSRIPSLAKDTVFDVIMQGIREQDVLADILNGVTNEIKVNTPLGIDVFCHCDPDHRVFQITKNGKQVYAFEEALSLENGGDPIMMRTTEDLFKMTTTILRKAFDEGEFTPFETEVLL